MLIFGFDELRMVAYGRIWLHLIAYGCIWLQARSAAGAVGSSVLPEAHAVETRPGAKTLSLLEAWT